MCRATSKVFCRPAASPVKSSQPNSHGTRIRWPLEEIGKNSVRPCTMPRTMAWRIGTGNSRGAWSVAGRTLGARSAASEPPAQLTDVDGTIRGRQRLGAS
jgi:hypothetical protein